MDSLPRKRPLILDGGMLTHCNDLGYDYKSSAELFILAHKAEIIDYQRRFVAAGSDIIYTPTWSANPFKLKEFGLEDKCAEFNKQLAEISVTASDKKALVAGDIGPSGVLISPYNEDISFTELMSQYDKQISALDKFVDLFVVETITSLSDLRAALLCCKKTGKPVIVTISVNEDGATYENEVPALSALIVAQEIGADAFGINCSRAEVIIETLKSITPYAKIPLVAKPCNWIYDGDKMFVRTPNEAFRFAEEMAKSGAEIIGGCCGTTPEHIAPLKTLSSVNLAAEVEKQDTSMVLSNERAVFFLEPDTTEISEPITCQPNMEEIITEACSAPVDILRVLINTPDDAIDYSNNAHMATLPTMFLSENEIALRMALMLYQGRALIDNQTSLSDEALDELCEKYGAVRY